mmetsp:Transcript_62631/g.111286  ORF Transcript_62631/g.111286 Transcript_62631/m.111286 type:complete len:102 (-) Transcript_62631:46-351(-)
MLAPLLTGVWRRVELMFLSITGSLDLQMMEVVVQTPGDCSETTDPSCVLVRYLAGHDLGTMAMTANSCNDAPASKWQVENFSFCGIRCPSHTEGVRQVSLH